MGTVCRQFTNKLNALEMRCYVLFYFEQINMFKKHNDTLNIKVDYGKCSSNLRIRYRDEEEIFVFSDELDFKKYPMFPIYNGNVEFTFINPYDFLIILQELCHDGWFKGIINYNGIKEFYDEGRFYAYVNALLNEIKSSRDLWKSKLTGN